MSNVTYGRMLLNEFSNMKATYDYVSYLKRLEDERLKALSVATEEEIKKYNLHKEHYLVRFLKQTTLEIMDIQNQLCSNSGVLIDDVIEGNSPRFKNDLMCLRIFISKLENEGYGKHLKAS